MYFRSVLCPEMKRLRHMQVLPVLTWLWLHPAEYPWAHMGNVKKLYKKLLLKLAYDILLYTMVHIISMQRALFIWSIIASDELRPWCYCNMHLRNILGLRTNFAKPRHTAQIPCIKIFYPSSHSQRSGPKRAYFQEAIPGCQNCFQTVEKWAYCFEVQDS